MWRKLPLESKRFWERKGRGGAPKFVKIPDNTVKKLKSTLKSGIEYVQSQKR